MRTIRYQPDVAPPETEIGVLLDRISQPGNTVLVWKGFAAWNATPVEEIQYSYRMDGGEWSPFSPEKSKAFLSLPSGIHTFKVRARDRDFNVDPTPATVRFTVVPPVWRQPWFIILVLTFVGVTGFQASRIVLRDRKLGEANAALSSANKELFSVNRELDESNRQIQEATRRKSRFLASMSHELRNPMNAIVGFTNLVLRRRAENLTDRQRENLGRVTQSADYLLRLIDEILDLSKVEAGRVEIRKDRFEVRDLIGPCCETVRHLVKPGVSLATEVGEGVGEIVTDEAKLRQIVTNLLSNALKFTESGEVRVACRVERGARHPSPPTPLPEREAGGTSHESRVTNHAGGDGWLVLAVSDTGIGIPAEALEDIFEEFHQVEGASQKEKGTGLGLAITKKLTELLGGTISVQSEVGKGSTFTVRISATYPG